MAIVVVQHAGEYDRRGWCLWVRARAGQGGSSPASGLTAMCAHTGRGWRREWWLCWRWAFQWMWQATRSVPCSASARVCATIGGCRPGRPCPSRAWSSRGMDDLSGRGSHCLAQCCHPHHLPRTAVSSLKGLLCRCSIHRARLETGDAVQERWGRRQRSQVVVVRSDSRWRQRLGTEGVGGDVAGGGGRCLAQSRKERGRQVRCRCSRLARASERLVEDGNRRDSVLLYPGDLCPTWATGHHLLLQDSQ